MNKITIKTLVPDAVCGNMTTNRMSVGTFASMISSNVDTINSFSSDDLIKSNRVRREKIMEVYNKYYASCIEKIKLLNELGKCDLIFDVPDKNNENSNNPDYISKYCMDYIETELQKKFLNTYRMNNRTIFITWKFVEFNKDLSKK